MLFKHLVFIEQNAYEYTMMGISSLVLLSAVRFWRHIVTLRESNNKEHQEYNNDG